MKEDTRIEGPWEFGTKPVKLNSKEDWEKIYKCAKEGRWEEIPKNVLIKHYNALQRIYKDNFKLKDRTQEKELLWYWGEPRTGKSRLARSQPCYVKLANKWWDNYKPWDPDHKRVVLDDLGKEKGKALADHLKLWADPWFNQPGEVK